MKHNVLLSVVSLISVVPLAATSFRVPVAATQVVRLQAKSASRVEGAILSGAAAKELFNQCSRATPQPDGWWKVSNRDVQNMEAALPRFWQNQKPRPRLPLANYRRQYAGYMFKGRTMIYLNAFKASQGGERWRTEPVNVCDGGNAYFGVEYDVKSRTFHNLHFNGR